MPRSSPARVFGFRAAGIARILSTADADEVLTALLVLGIDPRTKEGFDVLLEAAIEVAVAPILGLFKLFDDIVESIENVIVIVEKHDPRNIYEHDRNIKNASRIASGKVLVTKNEIDRLQKQFRERMNAAKLKFPPIAEPATPGVFEEA